MKKFLNLFFILTLFSLGFAHFAAPAQGGAGSAENAIACHCDSMKGMEQLKGTHKESYIIDCATSDRESRDQNNGQSRTAIPSAFAARTISVAVTHTPVQSHNRYKATITTDTPPPRYSA